MYYPRYRVNNTAEITTTVPMKAINVSLYCDIL